MNPQEIPVDDVDTPVVVDPSADALKRPHALKQAAIDEHDFSRAAGLRQVAILVERLKPSKNPG